MKWRSALHAAREQIVWIVALIGSTVIVVQLERLDLELAGTTLTENPFAATQAEFDMIRDQIRARNDGSDLAFAQLATVLAMGLLLDTTDDELRAEATDLLRELNLRLTESDAATLQSAAALLSTALKI